MKVSVLSILLLIISAPVLYAETVFPNCELNEISVVSSDPDNGVAVIKDQHRSEGKIFVGDQVGVGGWTVMEIKQLYIEIQSGDTITNISITSGYGKIQGP